MKSLERLHSKKARVLSEGDDLGDDSNIERVFDTSVSCSMTRVSRAGKDDGLNTLRLVVDPGCLGYPKRSSRILPRESRGNPVKDISGVERPENENVPFGPVSLMSLSQECMWVGDGRFAKCVAEMEERILFIPAPESRLMISRCAPLWRGMLEIKTLVVSAL